jgi:hypothetical protein
VRRLLALLALASCTVEREPTGGDPVPAPDRPAARTEAPASPRADAKATPEDPRAQLEAIVRPEAKVAEAPPLPGVPEPTPRRDAGVTLLEPGAEPREALHLRPAPSSSQALGLHLAMDVAMQLGKQAVPAQTVPALDVDLELKVADTPKTGTRYHLRVTDVRVQALEGGSTRVREAVTKAAEELRKIEGDGTLGSGTSPSEVLKVELADETGLEPAFAGFRDAYAHLFVQLPTDPIGTGARWEVVTHGDMSGMPVQRVATYTLEHRDGDRVQLDVTIAEHTTTPAPDAAAPPAAPTRQVRPIAYAATGQGEVEIDLSRVAPRTGSITSESSTRVEAAFGGNPTEVLMQLSVKAELAERAG